MATVESLVAELKALTPDQLEQVARVVRELAAESDSDSFVSKSVIDQAIRNGWPSSLFTQVIGRVGKDLKRPPQPPFDRRSPL